MNRQLINDGEKIQLIEINSRLHKEYTIVSTIGMGTSCIVYHAKYISGEFEHSCILKELYPKDCGLVREPDAVTLSFDIYNETDQNFIDDIKKKYNDICQRYTDAYEIQLKNQQSAVNSQDMDQKMMMALGISAPKGLYKNSNEILYTEYDYVEGMDYSRYSGEIKASEVIDIIIQTGEMISEFHRQGYIVLDIKEENIFITGGRNHRTAMLFDFGSLVRKENLTDYSFSKNNTVISFSDSDGDYPKPDELYKFSLYYEKGNYKNAELIISERLAKHGEKTDVFLLASLLFRRLFGKADCFEQIKNGESWKLPGKSVFLMKEDFRKTLKEIFDSAFQKRAEKRCTMSELTEKLRGLNNLDNDDILKINNTMAIRYHLYTVPLYLCSPKDKKTLDLLITGFGEFSQKFLDTLLPVVQVPGKEINVLIVSSDLKEWENYLFERPKLTSFFNVDGSALNNLDYYGNIRFVRHTFSAEDSEENQKYISELYEREHFSPDYTFVSAGSDSLNRFLATSFYSADSVTCYVNERIRNDEKKSDSLIPIYVSEDVTSYKLFSDIERMAFNSHLIWFPDLNIKLSEIKSEFLENSYNHDSCISFVLAMKYKLHAIGIDLDGNNYNDSAQKFSAYLESDKMRKDELIYYEHRRWVSEKICAGYSEIKNLEECADGLPKDEKNKRHGCIVRSNTISTLAEGVWTDRKMWDNPDPDELDKLDELDRMSIDLHRVYYLHAQKSMQNNITEGNLVSEIRNQIKCDKKCRTAFSELLSCMKGIKNDDTSQCRRYSGLLKTFLKSVEISKNLDHKEIITGNTETLKKQFHQIYSSHLYKDYKKEDLKLISGIPFILTYSDDISVIIPFRSENINAVFCNICVPAVINPAITVFTDYIADSKKYKKILKSVSAMENFFKKKNLNSAVRIIIGYNNQTDKAVLDALTDKYRSNFSVELIPASSRKEFAGNLKETLSWINTENHYEIYEKNDTPLSCVLEGTGFFDEVPSFRYNPLKMEFTDIRNCPVVQYIDVNPFISVTDMISLRKSLCKSSDRPEFYDDFKELWETYYIHTDTWRNVCVLLNNYATERDHIATLDFTKHQDVTISQYSRSVEAERAEEVNALINKMKKSGIISESSCVELKAAGRYIASAGCYNNMSKELFNKLISLKSVRFKIDEINRRAEFSYNNPEVENMDFSEAGEDAKIIFDFLSDHFYIDDLAYNDNFKVSFNYSSPQVKTLLTNKKSILELYTYHKVKESGFFDDILKDIEIGWENEMATSTFDCIMTRGFSSVFLESRSAKSIDGELYARIHSFVQYFGINALAVLVADTEDNEDTAKLNDIKRKYGEEFEIVTISDREDIKNIASRIVSLLNER